MTYGQTADGQAIARTTVNGHEFIAKGRDKAIAGRELTRTVNEAVELGKTALPPQPKVEE